MIKENSQISLTMELEGSVLLRKDIKTKTVSLIKSFRDKKTGEIKPVLDKHGKKQYITSEVIYEEPVYGKAIKHTVLPYTFIVNTLESPLQGYKVKHWANLPEKERIRLHIEHLCLSQSSKLLTYSILE